MKPNIHMPMNGITKRIANIAKDSGYTCFVHVYLRNGEFPYVPKGTRKFRDFDKDLDKFRTQIPSGSEWVLRHPDIKYVLQGMKMIHDAGRVYIFGKLKTDSTPKRNFIMEPLSKVCYDFAKKIGKETIFAENKEGWLFSDVDKFYMVKNDVFYGEKHWKDRENIAFLSTDGFGDFPVMRDMLLCSETYREVLAKHY